MQIDIIIREKIARLLDSEAFFVCGNTKQFVNFNFDEEWNEFETKTARFSFGGKYIDVIFTGNTVEAPIFNNIVYVKVGVFAGKLSTTTPAVVTAKKSILCEGGAPVDPPEDVYMQMMGRIAEFEQELKSAMMQADMNENDPESAAYVKDRTHYTDAEGNVIQLPNKYIPTAAADQIGGVMPVAKTEEMTEPIGSDESGRLWAAIPEAPQADMNESDPESAAYVKNRTHYTDAEGNVIQLPNKYIPTAAADQIGGVMPVAKTDEMTEPIGSDESGRLWAKIPKVPEAPQADMNENDPESAAYVKNRTHWIEYSSKEIGIAWDGNTSGKDVIELMPLGMSHNLYKVADYTPSLDEFKTGKFTWQNANATSVYDVTDSRMTVGEGEAGVIIVVWDGLLMVLVAKEAGTLSDGVVIPSAGLYFVKDNRDYYVSNFTYEGMVSEVHKLNNEFIDAEWMAVSESGKKTDILTWDGDFSGKETVTIPLGDEIIIHAVKVSDNPVEMSSLLGGTMVISSPQGDVTETITEELLYDGSAEGLNGVMIFSQVMEQAAVVAYDNVTAMGATLPRGIHLFHMTMSGMSMFPKSIKLTTPAFTGAEKPVKLPNKFLDMDYINSLIDAKLGVIENGTY